MTILKIFLVYLVSWSILTAAAVRNKKPISVGTVITIGVLAPAIATIVALASGFIALDNLGCAAYCDGE